jgi:hypothetical protein
MSKDMRPKQYQETPGANTFTQTLHLSVVAADVAAIASGGDRNGGVIWQPQQTEVLLSA